MAHQRQAASHAYGIDKIQLYGVGVGLGLDPLDGNQLAYLSDQTPKVLPSFATVAAWDIDFLLELGIDWSKLIHAAQDVELLAPLPPAANLLADTHIEAAFDKPRRNATLLITQTVLRRADTGDDLARLKMCSLARDFRVTGAPTGGPARPTPVPEIGRAHV